MESVVLFVSDSASVVLLADEQRGYRRFEYRRAAAPSDASSVGCVQTLDRVGSLAEVFAAELEHLLPVDGSPVSAPTVEPVRCCARSFARDLASLIGRAA